MQLTVYKASAGAGKTFTLTIHYLKLLLLAREGGEYAHILGVTFTNKATAEMKDRILSQLYGIAHGMPSSDSYLHALLDALRGERVVPFTVDEVRETCRSVLTQILHDYNRFRIQTIDSFFQLILRGLAHELGLTANLQVEINDREVLALAVDRIVDRLQDEPVVMDWMYSLVRDQIENNQKWDVRGQVRNFGRAIFNEDYLMRGDQLRLLLSDAQYVRNYLNVLHQMEKEALETTRLIGSQIQQGLEHHGVQLSDFSNGQRILGGLLNKLTEGQLADITISDTIRRWADDAELMVKKSDRASRPELLNVAAEISRQLSTLIEQLPHLIYIYNSVRLSVAHIKSLCLLGFIDQEVATINEETSRFNLAKTPILLRRMIGESDAPFVFEKMGTLLHHVMIDEFQDTSHLQWENFRTLLLESFSRGGRNLLVGDVKQSIYRWRGGDWRTLGTIEQQPGLQPKVVTLDTNFRSDRHVVTFNNEFFSAAAQMLDTAMSQEEEALQKPFTFAAPYEDVCQQVPASKPETGHVCVSVIDDSDENKRREEWQPLILEDLKRQIRKLHEAGLPFEQMTILVRKNDECQPIIDSFAEDTTMPPVVSDEAFLLSSSTAVCTLIEALRVLDDPDSPVALAYLSSEGIDLEAFQGMAEDLRLMPLYELLEYLFRDFRLKQRMPEQHAYLFTFFDAVTDYLHNEAANIHSFLSYWDERLARQAIPAGRVGGIRVITIHKAKGLEFHTVLIPFCTWAFESHQSGDLLWCTPTEAPFSDMPLLPITPSSKTAPQSVFAQEYLEERLMSHLDELNALYVAFTRACSNLFVWAVGSDMTSARHTIGDLVACTMLDLQAGTDDAPFLRYCVGRPVTTVREVHAKEENRMLAESTPVDVQMQSFPLNVTFRQSNRSQQFIAQLPAAAEGNGEITADGSSDVHRQDDTYLETGRLLHLVLQNIRTEADVPRVLDQFEHEGVISRTTADGTQVSVQRTDLERWIHQGLRNPLVAGWFTDEGELYNECSIVSLAADGTPEVRRPDRVMVNTDNNHIVVVDFKFGRHRPEYEEQVRGYMHLLKEMMPDATVDGYLWFVYTGKVQRV